MSVLLLPKKLNERGQCCGRKPLVYKRPTLHFFCCRCEANFSAEGEQTANWAYDPVNGNFTPRYPEQDYWQTHERAPV